MNSSKGVQAQHGLRQPSRDTYRFTLGKPPKKKKKKLREFYLGLPRPWEVEMNIFLLYSSPKSRHDSPHIFWEALTQIPKVKNIASP